MVESINFMTCCWFIIALNLSLYYITSLNLSLYYIIALNLSLSYIIALNLSLSYITALNLSLILQHLISHFIFCHTKLEASHRLTRSTPDISNRILDPRFKLNSRYRSRPRSPRSVYRILASQNVLKNKDPSSHMFYLEDHALKGKVDLLFLSAAGCNFQSLKTSFGGKDPVPICSVRFGEP